MLNIALKVPLIGRIFRQRRNLIHERQQLWDQIDVLVAQLDMKRSPANASANESSREEEASIAAGVNRVPLGHSYSPIPSTETIAAEARDSTLPGIKIRDNLMLEFMWHISAGYAGLTSTTHKELGRRYIFEH